MARLLLPIAFWLVVLLTPTSSIAQTSPGDTAIQAYMQAYMANKSAAWADKFAFSFGVYSDLHMAADWSSSFVLTLDQWKRYVTSLRDQSRDFGMIVGDMGYGCMSDVQNVLAGPSSVTNAPPVIYGMGNHELDYSGSPCSKPAGKKAWIDALYPRAVPASAWTAVAGIPPGNANHVYFSFNVGPYSHFIVLDGDYMVMGADGTARNFQSLGQDQLQWLQGDVKANGNKNLFVFIHEPIDQEKIGFVPMYTENDKGSLLDILSAHPKQKFILSGHYHSHSGITNWKGIKSIHANVGSDPNFGVTVQVSGEQVTFTGQGTDQVAEFDQYEMNKPVQEGSYNVQKIAEDSMYVGNSNGKVVTRVAAENGVSPREGSTMLKTTNLTWYDPRFVSLQTVKIMPGAQLEYDIYLDGVASDSNGCMDAVSLQVSWHTKDGTEPAPVFDQNGISMSRGTRDGLFHLYNEDTPRLRCLANRVWYRRVFDLSALAGNYMDGFYINGGAVNVNVNTVYMDRIRVSWPITGGNMYPQITVSSPAAGSIFTAPANISLSANATDADGSVVRVRYFSAQNLIGTSAGPSPFTVSWANVAAGSYSLTAEATDNAGAVTVSAPVQITVQNLVPNQPPSISLVSPSNNSTFRVREKITVEAAASDSDGSVSRVDFYAQPAAGAAINLGTRSSAPFKTNWTSHPAGTYAVWAVAVDDKGLTTTSGSVSVTVAD